MTGMGAPEEHDEGDTSLWRWGMLTVALLLALLPVAVGVWMIATAWGSTLLPIILIVFGPMVVLCALLVLSLFLEKWALMGRRDEADE